MPIATKRIYEAAEPGDGCRILVDRLWPRGLSREDARLDLWLKDLSPSAELRRWFGHDPARWAAFQTRYFAELQANQTALAELRAALARGPVTLLYAARDTAHNNAVALKAFLESRCDEP